MMVCERQKWSRAQFFGLSYDEQMDWLAWEMQRRKTREDALIAIQRDKSADIITARALLVLLQDG